MDGLPAPRRQWAMMAICCGTGLAVIDASIPTVALPTLASEFGVKSSTAVLVVTIYQLVLVMTLLPFSALGYRIGLRRLYQYGQFIFLVSTILCFFANSLPFLLVVRILQALGAAASLSVSSALIRMTFPAARLGRGLAINTVVVSSAGALAPTMGGLVLSVASWPWIFAVAAPLALVSLAIGWRVLPTSEPRAEPYDVVGAILCALTFGLVIAGLETMVHHQPLAIATVMIGAGAVIGLGFVRRELTVKMPMLPVDLLRNPLLALSALGGLLAFIASMTFTLSLPFRLEHHFGFKPEEVGAMITPWPLSIAIVGPLAGLLSDRVPAGILGGIGMLISTVSLLMLAFLPEQLNHHELMWRMALCGAGFGLFLPPNGRAIIHASPVHRAAAAGGLISTTRLTGQTLGATLLAWLLSAGMGDGRAPALVAAGLALLAGFCSLARLSVGAPKIRRPI